jgi:hypothetical protein
VVVEHPVMPTAPAPASDALPAGPTSWGSATWWRWVSRTTLGEAAGFLVPVLVVLSVGDLGSGPRLAVLLLAGAAEGAILGWAQASVLAPLLPGLSRNDWILRTAMAAVVAWGIGMGPSTWAGGLVGLPTAAVVVLAVPAGFVLLCSIGVAQWTVLRRHVLGAARWIAWTAGAWIVALGVFTAVTTPLWRPGQGAVTVSLIGVLGGLLMAVTMAAVTGAGLRRLLAVGPHPEPDGAARVGQGRRRLGRCADPTQGEHGGHPGSATDGPARGSGRGT